MNPDGWDEWDEREFRHWKDPETNLTLEEEEQIFNDYYNDEKLNADPDYTKKIYSQRDFDYRFERELVRVQREYKRKLDNVQAALSRERDVVIQMTARLEKVDKMQALLDRYALHSEIDYDKNTYEFVGYDERK